MTDRRQNSAGRAAADDLHVVSDEIALERTRPDWATAREAIGVVVYRPHLHKTLLTALIVGTVLFCINQLNVVIDGDATATVWIKSAVTYLVPFVVSNIGILVATRRATTTSPGDATPE